MITGEWRFTTLALPALMGGSAFLLMLWITTIGPCVGPDSVIYIETARSLLAGNGFCAGGAPMTHFPPLYPLLLSMIGLIMDGALLQAGRVLCAILFGVNVALFGFAVFVCTKGSRLAMGSAMLVFVFSAPIIHVHSTVMSEALFITFTLITFILSSFYILRPRLYMLLAAALSVGCAMATRYVGVTLLPPMVCCILAFGDRPLKRKIIEAVLAVVVASLPLAFWLVRNIIVSHMAADRMFEVHLFDFHNAIQLISVLYDFVLPIGTVSFSGWMKAAQLGFGAILYVVAIATMLRTNYLSLNKNTSHMVLLTFCLIFVLTYVSFLVVSISYFDAHTPLDARILLPAFLAITVAGFSLAMCVSAALDNQVAWYGFIVFMIASVAINCPLAVIATVDLHEEGNGYTSRRCQNSETIAAVMSIPGNVIIYSNGPDLISFRTGKVATYIPYVTFPTTRRPNLNYDSQLHDILKRVCAGQAVVVYFEYFTYRWYLPTVKQLETTYGLPVMARLNDGAIYGASRRPVGQTDYGVPHRKQRPIEKECKANAVQRPILP